MTLSILKCAVITPVNSDAEKGFAVTAESVRNAVTYDRGIFDDISHIRIDDPKDVLGPAKARDLGVEQAREAGADWVFFADAGVRLMPDIFRLATPALVSYDAVWGSSCVIDPEEEGAALIRESISAFDEFPIMVRRLHDYWFGTAHFVRLESVAEIGCDSGVAGQAAEVDYLLRLWRKARCIKTAQPYVALVGGWPPLDAAAKSLLKDRVADGRILIEFRYRNDIVKMPFTGRNSIIEGVQLRGQFFEQVALEYLAGHLEPGGTIIDVGANTGNHTVFFAKYFGASSVVPIEPNPEAILALEAALSANQVANVDISLLGIGLGGAEARFAISATENTTLGAVRLAPDSDGDVVVKPLDAVINGSVHLIKIDVEDMEIEVLQGATETVKRDRPLLYVEVMDKNLGLFMEWVNALDYRIDRIFPEFTFANYVLLPNG